MDDVIVTGDSMTSEVMLTDCRQRPRRRGNLTIKIRVNVRVCLSLYAYLFVCACVCEERGEEREEESEVTDRLSWYKAYANSTMHRMCACARVRLPPFGP